MQDPNTPASVFHQKYAVQESRTVSDFVTGAFAIMFVVLYSVALPAIGAAVAYYGSAH